MIFPKTDLGSFIAELRIPTIYKLIQISSGHQQTYDSVLFAPTYITNLKIYLIFTWNETLKKNYYLVAKNQFLEIMRDHDMCQLNFQ